MVVVAVTVEPRRWDMSMSAVVRGRVVDVAAVGEEGFGRRGGCGVLVVLGLSGESSGSSKGLPSMLLRGVPVEISVETDWLSEMRVEVAAEWRAGIRAGPGKRWAFVRWAQVAIRRGPRVYWDCTVSIKIRFSALTIFRSAIVTYCQCRRICGPRR